MPKRPLDDPLGAATAPVSPTLLSPVASTVSPPPPDAPTPLLANLTPSQFMRRHWQKKPLLIRQAIPGIAPPLSRDELFALETPDGIKLTTYDPALAEQMEVAESIMRQDRNVLRKLAK